MRLQVWAWRGRGVGRETAGASVSPRLSWAFINRALYSLHTTSINPPTGQAKSSVLLPTLQVGCEAERPKAGQHRTSLQRETWPLGPARSSFPRSYKPKALGVTMTCLLPFKGTETHKRMRSESYPTVPTHLATLGLCPLPTPSSLKLQLLTGHA